MPLAGINTTLKNVFQSNMSNIKKKIFKLANFKKKSLILRKKLSNQNIFP